MQESILLIVLKTTLIKFLVVCSDFCIIVVVASLKFKYTTVDQERIFPTLA